MSVDKKPLIIWTFRRSGGTNLGQALFEAMPFQKVQHEPFNVDRIYKHVILDWKKNRDYQKLESNIDAILKDKPLIKHCLEIMPDELNYALMRKSVEHGYRHLFLYREHATDRLLSLNYSQKTGVWGKEHKKDKKIDEEVYNSVVNVSKLMAHEVESRDKMEAIYNYLKKTGEKPISLTFESLYLGVYEYSKSLTVRSFELLGLKEFVPDDTVLMKMLRGGSQGTKSEYKVFPGSTELIKEADNLPVFKLNKNPTISIQYKKESISTIGRFELWDPQASAVDGEFIISGILYGENCKKKRMILRNDENSISFLANLNSPRIGKMFPFDANAEKSRFISPPITMNMFDVFIECDQNEMLLCSVEVRC